MRVQMVFNIGYIRFSNIDSASAVNFGQSMQQDWHSISKSNAGYVGAKAAAFYQYKSAEPCTHVALRGQKT